MREQLTTACAAKDPPSEASLHSLSGAIDRMEANIDRLKQKLAPHVIPLPEDPRVPERLNTTEIRSAHMERMYSMINRLNDLSNSLNTVVHNLDL